MSIRSLRPAVPVPHAAPLRRAVWNFLREEDGPTAVEYALMLALIVAVCIGSVGSMSAATEQSFEDSAATIAGAFAN